MNTTLPGPWVGAFVVSAVIRDQVVIVRPLL